MQSTPIIFVKGRVGGKLDLLPFFKAEGRVTLGYLAWRKINDFCVALKKLHENGPLQYADYLLLPSEVTTGHNEVYSWDRWKRNINSNATLAKKIERGSFVVVPRPRDGTFYLGKLEGKFRLWDINQRVFESIRDAKFKCQVSEDLSTARAKLPVQESAFAELDLYAQASQGWLLTEVPNNQTDRGGKFFRAVPLIRMPAIIRKVMASRRGNGQIGVPPDYLTHVNAYLDALWTGQRPPLPKTTLDKLRFYLTPTSFEHLCVDLLNLRDEKAGIRWLHVGGSGDGGVDAAGFDAHGKMTRVLQCKFERNTTPEKVLNEVRGSFDDGHPEVVFASLWERGEKGMDRPRKNAEANSSSSSSELEVLDGPQIAELCTEHLERVPLLKHWLRDEESELRTHAG